MIVVFYGWLLFRAQSMSQIMDLTSSLFAWSFPTWISSYVLNLVVFMAPLLAMQVWQYRTNTIFPMLPHNTCGQVRIDGDLRDHDSSILERQRNTVYLLSILI
jgi:hypothetical protein